MMNDKKHIESLLHLFMQGESTLEQERELSQYFASDADIPDEWMGYKELFAYFDQGLPLMATPMQQRRSLVTRPLWVASAVSAVAAIGIVIATMVGNHTPNRNTLTTTPQVAKSNEPTTLYDSVATSITAQSMPPTLIANEDGDGKTTFNVVRAAARSQANEKISTRKDKAENKAKKVDVKPSLATLPHLDSIEMERERGRMELVQQELMADRLIIEKEREEALIERQRTRARAFQAQQDPDSYNTAPNAILVVFQ